MADETGPSTVPLVGDADTEPSPTRSSKRRGGTRTGGRRRKAEQPVEEPQEASVSLGYQEPQENQPEASSEQQDAQTETPDLPPPVRKPRRGGTDVTGKVFAPYEDGRMRLGATGIRSVVVEVPLDVSELEALRGLTSIGAWQHPATLVRYGVSMLTGATLQPYRFRGRHEGEHPEKLPRNAYGVMLVHTHITEQALDNIRRSGAKRNGCRTDGECVRWAVLRGGLRLIPQKIRERMCLDLPRRGGD